MSPRALTAVAVLTAALAGPAGRAAAQYPPDAAPVGGPFGGFPAAPGGNPYFAGLPEVAPVGPTVMPVQGGYPAPPGPMIDPGGIPIDAGLPIDGYGGISRGPKAWVGVEYLLFWAKDAPLSVPIATVGPAAGTATLGSSGTRVLVGNADFDYSNFSGVRVVGGYWLTNNESLGIEGNVFILPEKRSGTPALVGTDILPTLARPFVDTTTGRQNSRVLTRPGFFTGGIRTDATHELWGAEIGPVWRAIDRGGRWTVDGLAGFKFLSLDEGLTITDFSTAQRGGIAIFQGRGFPAGATTHVRDEFHTTNRFYGGMIGSRANLHVEAFTLSVAGKLGIGTMEQEVRADGTTTLVGAGPLPTTSGGGFFAVAGNTGRFEQSEFTVIPELATNLSVQVTSCLSVTFGYTYLYVDNVIRPGDQLSTRLNPTLVPTSQNFGARFGPRQETLRFVTTDYWAQGFNLGLTVGY